VNPTCKKTSLYREAILVTLLGVVMNAALAVGKLVGGWLGDSFALLSDAANSLGDVAISLGVLYALRVAQRPPDKEHPYGHTRAEGIAGLTVALLVGVAAAFIAWEAVQQLSEPHVVPARWTIAVAAVNLIIKEGLYHFSRRVGDRTGSTAIAATAWDHRADALCSAVVLVGLLAAVLGGPSWAVADDLAALAVAAAVMYSAAQLFIRAGRELMDMQADDTIVDQVRDSAADVSGVRGVETLWVRKSGLEYFADIHVEVDADLSVAEGHRIGHNVKDELLRSYPQLRDVLVHVEPYDPERAHHAAADGDGANTSLAADQAKASPPAETDHPAAGESPRESQ
jgi:cation diffusion facilitator family transporter